MEIYINPTLTVLLPETSALLQSGCLRIHPCVRQVNLEGSRGPGGHPRLDSDIDLSLLLDDRGLLPGSPEHAALVREVLHTTLDAWHAAVELDLAVCFDVRGCGLACFNVSTADEFYCPCQAGVDCCGLYKEQRGFTGYVPPIGVRMTLLYPTLILWRREA